MSADRWPDESDIEPRFVCGACGKRGAEVRPDWQTADRNSDGSDNQSAEAIRRLVGLGLKAKGKQS